MVAVKRSFPVVILLTVLVALGWTQVTRAEPGAQASPTSIQLQFPTATETQGPPTETPTRTPTSEGRPWAEAVSEATNVRAEPDINGDRVAQIYPGTRYPILAKRFQWYQIEFPNTPNGIAWVHESVITVNGDETLIPELEEVPTSDPVYLAAQQTAEVLEQTPGALATQTAMSNITPTGVFTADPGEAAPTLEPGAPLPTYTNPPYTPTPLVVPRTSTATTTTDDDSGLPPLVPIMALGALGLMGLLVAALRRL